jgi:hypothetical protein
MDIIEILFSFTSHHSKIHRSNVNAAHCSNGLNAVKMCYILLHNPIYCSDNTKQINYSFTDVTW